MVSGVFSLLQFVSKIKVRKKMNNIFTSAVYLYRRREENLGWKYYCGS